MSHIVVVRMLISPIHKFTAVNLSVAISSIRENMGLVLAALQVCGIGCIWLLIAACACVNAYKTYGKWTILYFVFSYYWTQQVLTSVVSVATAGNIGRWFVMGESCPDLNTGLKVSAVFNVLFLHGVQLLGKDYLLYFTFIYQYSRKPIKKRNLVPNKQSLKQDTLTRARSYSFGSICVESLFFGVYQMVHGLSQFLSSLHVPLLPRLLDGFTWCISRFTSISEWTYVYIGLYGYSYTSAERNITTLFKNNDMDVMLRNKFAGNILFMSNMTIGLLTGVCGLIFGTFGYRAWRRSGLPNPASDGFL